MNSLKWKFIKIPFKVVSKRVRYLGINFNQGPKNIKHCCKKLKNT